MQCVVCWCWWRSQVGDDVMCDCVDDTMCWCGGVGDLNGWFDAKWNDGGNADFMLTMILSDDHIIKWWWQWCAGQTQHPYWWLRNCAVARFWFSEIWVWFSLISSKSWILGPNHSLSGGSKPALTQNFPIPLPEEMATPLPESTPSLEENDPQKTTRRSLAKKPSITPFPDMRLSHPEKRLVALWSTTKNRTS